jgi:hypothetical protein
MMPLMLPVLLLVTDKALLSVKAIAPAVKVAVLMVRPVSGVLPIEASKTVSPVVLVVSVLAPSTAALNHSLPLLVLDKVAFSLKVIAPL